MAHPFRSVPPTLSTALLYVQLDRTHPCWQYPHGTKSHGQAPIGEGVGSCVRALLSLGALLVGSEVHFLLPYTKAACPYVNGDVDSDASEYVRFKLELTFH